MPPPPSSSSSSAKKKKGGKKKKHSTPPPQPTIDDDEIQRLSKAYMATSFGRDFRRAEERIQGPGWVDAPTCPDNPPCDGCAQPFVGTMQCSRCESVFYCGRDCQVSHWTSMHRAECSQLKQQNEETAKHVLGSFRDASNWEDLDLAGAYKAAVHQGLHDKIREVMALDTIHAIAERCGNTGVFVCYTRLVMSTLFCGQRAEGKKDQSTNSFNCMDGLRIKGYVRSHPEALNTWLHASVQLVHAVVDRSLLREPQFHFAVHHTAMHVWAMWTLVFTSSVASRAIFAPPFASAAHSGPSRGGSSASGGDDGNSSAEQRRTLRESHARRIVTIVGDTIRLFDGGVDPRLDPDEGVGSSLLLVAALVQLRVQEYRIGINVEPIWDLKGIQKNAYRDVLLPMAKRMVEKGRNVTPQEASAMVALATGAVGLGDK